MAYSTVSKPSVGDPIKLSTIEGIIDNQEHFQASIAANAGFNADGSFENPGASVSEPALGWNESSGNALTIARTNTGADPNTHGEYSLKLSGSFGQTGGIETDLFPVSDLEAYVITIASQVDDSGDKFEIQFITYERDGATSVQTVSNPLFTDASTSDEGINDATMTKRQWVVSAGTDARFGKLKVIFTVNSSVASAGYLDHVNFERQGNRTIVYKHKNFWELDGTGTSILAHEMDVYCPKWCKTYFVRYNETKRIITGTNQNVSYPMHLTMTAGTTTATIADIPAKTSGRGVSWLGEIDHSTTNQTLTIIGPLVDDQSGLVETTVTATAWTGLSGFTNPESLHVVYVPEIL